MNAYHIYVFITVVGISVTLPHVLLVLAASDNFFGFRLIYTRTWFKFFICGIHIYTEPKYTFHLKRSDGVKHAR